MNKVLRVLLNLYICALIGVFIGLSTYFISNKIALNEIEKNKICSPDCGN